MAFFKKKSKIQQPPKPKRVVVSCPPGVKIKKPAERVVYPESPPNSERPGEKP